MNKNLFAITLATALAITLTACGGGGSSPSSPAVGVMPPAPAPTPAPPTPTPAPAPAPAPGPVLAPAPTATLPAGTVPAITAADCPKLLGGSANAPTVAGADMKLANDVLLDVDPNHSYAEFSRLPATLTWWMRSAGSADEKVVNQWTLSAAIHETNHELNSALRYRCHFDGLARYFVDGQVNVTGLKFGDTDNYSIVSETYPAALKSARALRFDLYVTGAAKANGNDFSALLDELAAYSGGANFEVNLLSNPTYSYLSKSGDLNVSGMVDFMLFLESYLKAARLNHPSTYSAIQSQSQTLDFIQFSWSRAERILVLAYPFSMKAGGTQVVPVDVLAQIYSAPFLAELDLLGIAHKPAADWSTTYLR